MGVVSSGTRVAAPLTQEGRLEVEGGYTIAYRVFGDGGRTLLGLHGGPASRVGISIVWPRWLAATSSSCSMTSWVAATRIVLTTPISGRSRASCLRSRLFVPVSNSVRSLSWASHGEACWPCSTRLDYPRNVRGLILSNTTASAKDYLLDVSEHRVALGKDVHALMLKCEYEDELDDPEYQDAVLELELEAFAAIEPVRPRAFPPGVPRGGRAAHGGHRARLRALGPHEFRGTGPEAYFDVVDRLREIKVPALIVCGFYDELTPWRCSRPLADGIADNEFVILGNSSHLTILEKRAELYLAAIRDWLDRHP